MILEIKRNPTKISKENPSKVYHNSRHNRYEDLENLRLVYMDKFYYNLRHYIVFMDSRSGFEFKIVVSKESYKTFTEELRPYKFSEMMSLIDDEDSFNNLIEFYRNYIYVLNSY